MKQTITNTLVIILTFLSCVYHVSGQTPVGPGIYAPVEVMDLMERINRAWVIGGKNDPIEGSPYLKEEFEPGEIKLNDESVFPNLPMRYEVFLTGMKHEQHTLTHGLKTDQV